MNRIEMSCLLEGDKLDFLLHVDGRRLLPLHSVNIFALEDSLRREGEFPIFTCNGRVPGCRKLAGGVRVDHQGTVTIWTLPAPAPVRVLAFETEELRGQFHQAQQTGNRLSREYLAQHGDLPDFAFYPDNGGPVD
ncbi:MAG TPA: hypothetical protein VF646_19510 [Cytophagales bacterium]